jgi:hypothetical protein
MDTCAIADGEGSPTLKTGQVELSRIRRSPPGPLTAGSKRREMSQDFTFQFSGRLTSFFSTMVL